MSPAQQRWLALWAALLTGTICLSFLPLSRLVSILILLVVWGGDNGLLAQAKALWPQKPEVAELQLKWQQRQAESKLPPDSLTGWHNGMQQLQALTDKLNGLDGQKGKYITVSELKSVVYEMTRSFSQTVPLEEQLRLMQSQQGDAALATQQQIQRHLNGVIQVYGEQGSKEGF